MNSGKCHGGPLDGKMLHHSVPSYMVAVDPHARRGPNAVPGMIATADPDIRFGTYRFAAGLWTWRLDSE